MSLLLFIKKIYLILRNKQLKAESIRYKPAFVSEKIEIIGRLRFQLLLQPLMLSMHHRARLQPQWVAGPIKAFSAGYYIGNLKK